MLFAVFFRCCVAVYPAISHHLRRAGTYHSTRTRSTDTRYQRRAGRCTAQHNRPIQPPYYNKVYKGAAAHRLLWIHARRCSISQTMPARRGLDASHARRLKIWHRSAVRAHRVSLAPSIRQGSPAAGARRAARNHWRLPPYLFSGCRPIANRGQQ